MGVTSVDQSNASGIILKRKRGCVECGKATSQTHHTWCAECYEPTRVHGVFGFSAHDVEELAMQGVKPWDDDASAVMTVLNGGY